MLKKALLTMQAIPFEYRLFGNPANTGRIIHTIERLLDGGHYKFADFYYGCVRLFVPHWRYRQLCSDHLATVLSEYNFNRADEIFRQMRFLEEAHYRRLKAGAIRRFAQERFDIDLIDEQAHAVAALEENVLVTARAGSGKTTVVSVKAASVLNEYAGNPNEIMVLAFNRDAAAEVKQRLQEQLGFKRFDNARTFHSLAFQIVRPAQKLLSEETEQTQVIQEILNDLNEPNLSAQVVQFFRKELEPLGARDFNADESAFFHYRRNLRQMTLRGERVRSNGEKYIADFLFEHSVRYSYEQPRRWNGSYMYPDFTLFQDGNEVILEHWGIDENDPNRSAPEWWERDWDQYKQVMFSKRAYWANRCEHFVETSIVDLANGREQFEKILASRLKTAGIKIKKLSDDEITQKVRERQETRLAKLMLQFVQRAKQKGLGEAEIRDLADSCPSVDVRTKVFWKIACEVYERYMRKFEDENLIDFNDFINLAIEKIDACSGDCGIRTDSGDFIMLTELKWLLIDEYQDFSPAFNRLVNSIRKYNPDLRIFCVGDDWQAINGFAGSDLYYFHEFPNLRHPAETAHLLTNHRSNQEIVNHGNQFMVDEGALARARDGAPAGEVCVCNLDGIFLPPMNGGALNIANFHWNDGDGKKYDPGFFSARTVKACYDIITADPGSSYAILSRTSWIYGRTHGEYQQKLSDLFDDGVKDRVTFSTIHSYKGLEADVVIIVPAIRGQLPFFHPDNQLFLPYGVTPSKVLAEEKRLYYVALTRARKRLWILTEQGRESEYVRMTFGDKPIIVAIPPGGCN